MRRDLLAIGCPDEKIEVHYHGSNTRRFPSLLRTERYDRDGPLTVMYCEGPLEVSQKAQHLVLQALRRVERRGCHDFRARVPR